MDEIIQHIIFPETQTPQKTRDLFFRGDFGRLNREGRERHLQLRACQWVDFATYLNGVSWGKWRKYTGMEGVTLSLEYAGKAEIILVGYSLVQNYPVRTLLEKQEVSSQRRTEMRFAFPQCEDSILGFEIATEDWFELFSGAYIGAFPGDSARDIEISIATTTFKRETYIRRNMRMLKESLLDLYPEQGAHIRVHVVDNGRTLQEEDLPQDPEHFLLHPNLNTGGSGGYARGMMETLYQTPEATHIILMDDDIEIIPDSIFRTYELLRFVKEEYREHFISGAMLMMERKNKQHEDIGSINNIGRFRTVKPKLDHSRIRDNLLNEEEYHVSDMFQGWWYCVIPVPVIRQNGLPLPLFIRGDDMEYSLRCKAKIMSMNGICLWHMGFGAKFSASMCAYQELRNFWIAQSTSDILPGRNFFNLFKISFRACILRRDYASAEMFLRMLEDYLKGPAFLQEANGERIMKENSAVNEKLVPLNQIDVPGFNPYEDPSEKVDRNGLKTFLYRLTWNGHRFCPDRLLNHAPASIPYGFAYLPGRMEMRKTVIAVDEFNHTAVVRELDRARYKTLRKRFRKVVALYKKHGEQVKAEYRKQSDYLKSEEFWRKYLKMD